MTQKVIVIQGEGLGRGDDKLGSLLMANFLRLLGERETRPEQIIFWNTGVRLVCEGSPVLGHLQNLEKQGVELLACTTCLEYLGLYDKIVIGKSTTMMKSITSMMNYDFIGL
jgi:selenium metabolism protein YedF